MKLGWKTRVGLVMSVVWLCLVFLAADGYQRLSQVLVLGLLPLIVIWGIVWAVAGWRAQRPEKPTTPEAVQLEAKARRSLRIRTGIAVVVVLWLGMYAATWQFSAADNEAGGRALPQWFGEWCVYGLIAYAILRAVPKLPAGSPAVLAALIIVGAVNYKAHSVIAENKRALESLAVAAPLILKISSGTPLSNQEVTDARVGMLEPLLLALATYNRELHAISAAYEATISGTQPELMLTPASLASPGIRAQTRAKLKLQEQAMAEFNTQIAAATARGKLAIKAAQSQMPASMSDSPSKGFDASTANLSVYLETHVTAERESRQVIVGMLNLMDANPGGYVVDKGPPVNLLFRDEATLARYRELMDALMAARQRDQEGRGRLVKAEADRIEKLGALFKR